MPSIDDDVPETKVVDRNVGLCRAARLTADEARADLIDVDAPEDVDVAKRHHCRRYRNTAVVGAAYGGHGLIKADAVRLVMLDGSVSLPSRRCKCHRAGRRNIAADGDCLRMKLMMKGKGWNSEKSEDERQHAKPHDDLLQTKNAGGIAGRRGLPHEPE